MKLKLLICALLLSPALALAQTTLQLNQGGTGAHAWTASTCVHINSAGTAMESVSGDCLGVSGTPLAQQLSIFNSASQLIGYSGLTWNNTTKTFALPAGSVIESADTGTPSMTFGTNSVAFNQPITVGTPATYDFTIAANGSMTGNVTFTGPASQPAAGYLHIDASGNITSGTPSGSGNVTGPGSSTTHDLAAFADTSGTLLEDSGVAASALAPLASPSFTGTVTLPSGFFSVNGTGNSTQTGLEAVSSTANSVGLTVTPSNPSGNQWKFEITGSSYTGNAATSTVGLGLKFGSTSISDSSTAPTSGQCLYYDGTYIGGTTCGSGGGVSSFSGDGTLLSNSASTGAVTATLANAGAYSIWGNNSGSSAAPSYSFTAGTGANDLVQLDSSGKLPAVDGSQLTNLPTDINPSSITATGTTTDGLGTRYNVNISSGGGTVYLPTAAAAGPNNDFFFQTSNSLAPTAGDTLNGGTSAVAYAADEGASCWATGANTWWCTPPMSALAASAFPTLNQSTTGNAATATDLASYPTLCSGGQFSQGLSSGSNNCATPGGSGTVTTSGSPVAAELSIFSGATAITGYSGLTWTTASDTLGLPAGSVIESADTGTPGMTFGTDSITFNQPVTVGTPATYDFTIAANGSMTGNVTFTGPASQPAAGFAHLDSSGNITSSQPLGAIPVTDYGATGDGSTDDTADFQAAITAATNGGTVFVANGTYKLTSGISVTHAVKIVCESVTGTTLDFSTLASGAAVTFSYGNAPGAGIRGCKIAGPGSGTSTQGVQFGTGAGSSTAAVMASIEENEITSFGTGVAWDSYSYMNRVRGNWIHANGIGLDVQAENNRLRDNNISANSTGIRTSGTVGLNSNNDSIDDNTTYGIDWEATGGRATLVGDHFEDSSLAAFTDYIYTTSTSGYSDIRMVGGEFEDNETSGSRTELVKLNGAGQRFSAYGVKLHTGGGTVSHAVNFAASGQSGFLVFENNGANVVDDFTRGYANDLVVDYPMYPTGTPKNTITTALNDLAGFQVNGSAGSGHYLKGDGTNFVESTGSASGTGSCTNQAVTALNSDAAPSCSTLDSNYLAAANKSIAKSFVITSPTTSNTNQVQWYYAQAVTLTRVACSTDTGTVTIQIDTRSESTPNTAGTNTMTSSLSCTSTTGTTTSFSSSAVSADNPVNLQISSTSGTPGVVRVHVDSTIN